MNHDVTYQHCLSITNIQFSAILMSDKTPIFDCTLCNHGLFIRFCFLFPICLMIMMTILMLCALGMYIYWIWSTGIIQVLSNYAYLRFHLLKEEIGEWIYIDHLYWFVCLILVPAPCRLHRWCMDKNVILTSAEFSL